MQSLIILFELKKKYNNYMSFDPVTQRPNWLILVSCVYFATFKQSK